MKLAGIDIELNEFESAVVKKLTELEEEDFFGRLRKKDPSIRKPGPDRQEIISNSSGWLDSARSGCGIPFRICRICRSNSKDPAFATYFSWVREEAPLHRWLLAKLSAGTLPVCR